MIKRLLTKSIIISALAGLLLGALIILGIRFVTYKPEVVHYHANFAIYINGQREQFKSRFYYEDIGSGCTLSHEITPYERAHMHDSVNDVVHVEDHAVTWGQFFQNLQWYIDSGFIKTPDQLLQADGQHKITFILNGNQMIDITNSVIKDKDKLLVDYGDAPTQVVQKEYQAIPDTAAKYDGMKNDASSCGGHQESTTMYDRLVHMF